MQVIPIPALSDNYIWVYEANSNVIVVDPGEAQPVLEYLENNPVTLKTVLLTHKHPDHVDGLAQIVEKYPATIVYGPSEVADIVDYVVKDGDTINVLDRIFKVLKTAGHTAEHVSYLSDELLFCGDALFSAGCGRVFTGDYQAQFDALQVFKGLADDVQVFAGHEYTQTNLRFAQTLDMFNDAMKEALGEVADLRTDNLPTLPSQIGLEKEINPFLRADTVAEFIALRKARDDF